MGEAEVATKSMLYQNFDELIMANHIRQVGATPIHAV